MKKFLVILFTVMLLSGCENKKTSHEYSIYVTNTTLPTLYAAIDLSSHSNEAYIWYGRNDTLNINYLKEKKYQLSNYIGEQKLFNEKGSEEIIQYIKNIVNNDSEAKFKLFVEDSYSLLEENTLLKAGLNSEQYEINYITSGTLTYTISYPYQFEDGYEKYQKYEKSFNEILDHSIENMMTEGIIYSMIGGKRANANYYLQYPQYIKMTDNKVQKEIEKINFISDSPKELFNKLNDEQKINFYRLVGFNKEEMDKNYFNGDRPFLIITGSKPIEYSYGEIKFKNMIEQVVEQYQKDYIILFKPHPSALPDETYTNYFKKLKIKILPGKMPMEVISFVLKIKNQFYK